MDIELRESLSEDSQIWELGKERIHWYLQTEKGMEMWNFKWDVITILSLHVKGLLDVVGMILLKALGTMRLLLADR